MKPRTPLAAGLGWLRRGHGRQAGAALLVLLAGLQLFLDSRPQAGLRNGLFDSYQRMAPRHRSGDGVIVVEIDDHSVSQIGQWPWPRTLVADLVRKLAAERPAVIAIDLLFSEPDRLSPRALARQFTAAGLSASELADLPDSDEELAAAIKAAPVVLGVGALLNDAGLASGIPYRPILRQFGGEAAPFVPRFASALRSLEDIDRAAAGHGAFNAIGDDGIVRRVPTLITVGDNPLPGLAMETLRTLTGDPILSMHVGPRGLDWVGAGDLEIPTDNEGGWWLHFSNWLERPRLSAADVLDGKLPAGQLKGRVVLFVYTALGLLDNVTTALGTMPGVHVHAEALDNAIDGRLLSLPHWAPMAQVALLALLAAMGLWVVPILPPALSAAVFAGLALAAGALGLVAFAGPGWLLDVANPLAGAGVVFAFMLTVTLGETQAQRRRLKDELIASREAQARLEGELDAARRIQMGMLPRPQDVLRSERRVQIAARIQPARTVGGDLYDFFMLDATQLFFQIGDVAGKGLPASLFMALAKALTKGAALRAGGDPGRALTDASAAISSDNPEQLFVTMLAGVLDLESGELAWCSAGHEAPYLLRAGAAPQRQSGGGGPPLCVIDGFAYPAERLRLVPGDLLCLVTDGVTEAQNAAGDFFGTPRLLDCLRRLHADARVDALADAIEKDIAEFVGGAEPADDVTILVLRWPGGGRGA